MDQWELFQILVALAFLCTAFADVANTFQGPFGFFRRLFVLWHFCVYFAPVYLITDMAALIFDVSPSDMFPWLFGA